jgi:hypothetical protein
VDSQILVILVLDVDGCIIIDTSVLLADVSDFAVGFFGRNLEFAFLGFFEITHFDLYTIMSIVVKLKIQVSCLKFVLLFVISL